MKRQRLYCVVTGVVSSHMHDITEFPIECLYLITPSAFGIHFSKARICEEPGNDSCEKWRRRICSIPLAPLTFGHVFLSEIYRYYCKFQSPAITIVDSLVGGQEQ